MREIDEKQQKYYLSFVKRFKGLEGMRQFSEHINICPDCWELFKRIIVHMAEKRENNVG